MGYNIFNEYEGEWVIVDNGASKFIGRIVETPYTDSPVAAITNYIAKFGTNGYITLQPVFDYILSLIRDPDGGGIHKQILVTPYGICLTFKSSLTLKATSIMFFNAMDPSDRNEYEKYVNEGADVATRIRAQMSGIEIATKMPSQNNPLIMK